MSESVEQLNKHDEQTILDRLKNLEIEIEKLKEENQKLREKIEKKENEQQKDNKETTRKVEQYNKVEQTKESVLGFSIRIENTWTQGKQYSKYYAIKRIKGRHHRIYIGKDTSFAEEKIKSYCSKHGLEIPS